MIQISFKILEFLNYTHYFLIFKGTKLSYIWNEQKKKEAKVKLEDLFQIRFPH